MILNDSLLYEEFVLQLPLNRSLILSVFTT